MQVSAMPSESASMQQAPFGGVGLQSQFRKALAGMSGLLGSMLDTPSETPFAWTRQSPGG